MLTDSEVQRRCAIPVTHKRVQGSERIRVIHPKHFSRPINPSEKCVDVIGLRLATADSMMSADFNWRETHVTTTILNINISAFSSSSQ